MSSHTHLRYPQISRNNPIDLSNIADCRHLLTDCNILNERMLADMQRSSMYQAVFHTLLNCTLMYEDINYGRWIFRLININKNRQLQFSWVLRRLLPISFQGPSMSIQRRNSMLLADLCLTIQSPIKLLKNVLGKRILLPKYFHSLKQ